ncbi:hypothetical protein DID88_007838 [Monilinia fructigena]|uniref:Uncharacterized protein n=1 Tax=Monilinia fructigena TaxID=38457 RepID=A0A395J4I3_9HELO|nr:hypothetical protein DID88_007838 [Monilinia fructigena]
MRQRENIRLATFPAFSAESMPAIIKSVKVDVNIRKAQMKAKHETAALVDGIGHFGVSEETNGVVPCYEDDEGH